MSLTERNDAIAGTAMTNEQMRAAESDLMMREVYQRLRVVSPVAASPEPGGEA